VPRPSMDVVLRWNYGLVAAVLFLNVVRCVALRGGVALMGETRNSFSGVEFRREAGDSHGALSSNWAGCLGVMAAGGAT